MQLEGNSECVAAAARQRLEVACQHVDLVCVKDGLAAIDVVADNRKAGVLGVEADLMGSACRVTPGFGFWGLGFWGFGVLGLRVVVESSKKRVRDKA